MVKPRDESVRARFASELDRNFSVVASAGSGKTTGIIERILSIARSPNAAEILPRLVVVTFTNRAADEMQQRTRQALLQENLRQEVQTAFNRAFFGTIHSFCMKLLTDFGHYLGLPAPLELVEDDDDLWQEFAQNQTRIGRSLGEKDRAMLLRFVQARDLMELARRARSAVLQMPGLSPCPPLDFAEVHSQSNKGRGTTILPNRRRNCANGKSRFAGDWEYLRWPVCFTAETPGLLSSGKKNLRLCDNGSAPPPRASQQRCSVIISIFDSTTDWSLTEIKSRSRKSCCNIRSPRREFAKKAFVSSSTRHRTLTAAIFCAAGSDAPAGSEGSLVEDQHLGPRPGLLHGRRFPAIDLLGARGLNYYRAVHEALISTKR